MKLQRWTIPRVRFMFMGMKSRNDHSDVGNYAHMLLVTFVMKVWSELQL